MRHRKRDRCVGAGPRTLLRNRPAGLFQLACLAFTLIEVAIVVLIISTLSTMTVPVFLNVMQRAKEESTQEEMRQIETAITGYLATKGELPDSLEEIGMGDILDPWGRPYEYTRIAGAKGGVGHLRKDQFLVPLNSDYDLYSKGPDGKSASALTAKTSRDDIIRANDGAYFGLASEY